MCPLGRGKIKSVQKSQNNFKYLDYTCANLKTVQVIRYTIWLYIQILV